MKIKRITDQNQSDLYGSTMGEVSKLEDCRQSMPDFLDIKASAQTYEDLSVRNDQQIEILARNIKAFADVFAG